MKIIRNIVLAAVLALAVIPPAQAHSLQELDDELKGSEQYFQPVDSAIPDFVLQDGEGRSIHWSDFRGKVVVLHFIYTSCSDVCPLHAERIAQLQSMINQTPMKDKVAFITITTDPKRDTGDVLRNYGTVHGLSPVNWIFLTAPTGAPDDTTRKLAEAYGLKFSEDKDGVQMHGVVTHVIDQDGRLRARFHGLQFDPAKLVVYVNALTNHIQTHHPHGEPSFWERLKTWF